MGLLEKLVSLTSDEQDSDNALETQNNYSKLVLIALWSTVGLFVLMAGLFFVRWNNYFGHLSEKKKDVVVAANPVRENLYSPLKNKFIKIKSLQSPLKNKAHINPLPSFLPEDSVNSKISPEPKEGELVKLLKGERLKQEYEIKIYEILAQMYFSAEQLEQAKILVDQGLAKNLKSVELVYVKAKLQAKKGNLKSALKTLISLHPQFTKNTRYYGFMAKLYLQTKQTGLAVMLYQKLSVLQPMQGKWWLGLGLAYEQQGAVELSKKALLTAKQLGGHQPFIEQFLNEKTKQGSAKKTAKEHIMPIFNKIN